MVGSVRCVKETAGGAWPISVLAGDYARVWSGLGEIFATLDESERSAMLGGTAAEVYAIDPARLDPARLSETE